MLIQQPPNGAGKFCGSIRCAGLSSCAGELGHANTMVQVSAVFLFHHIRESRIECSVDVCGQALRSLHYMATLYAKAVCQIFQEVGEISRLQTGIALTARFFLIGQYNNGCVRWMFAVQERTQCRIRANTVIMTITTNHAAV